MRLSFQNLTKGWSKRVGVATSELRVNISHDNGESPCSVYIEISIDFMGDVRSFCKIYLQV